MRAGSRADSASQKARAKPRIGCSGMITEAPELIAAPAKPFWPVKSPGVPPRLKLVEA
jgi:hypothetical protein